MYLLLMGSCAAGSHVKLFVQRDAMHKRGLCRHVVSVHPSVCHVYQFFLKRVVVSSQLFTVRYPNHSSCSLANVFRQGLPVECR